VEPKVSRFLGFKKTEDSTSAPIVPEVERRSEYKKSIKANHHSFSHRRKSFI